MFLYFSFLLFQKVPVVKLQQYLPLWLSLVGREK